MTPKPENKPIIAIDIDDVLADEAEGVQRFVQQEYGHTHKADDDLFEGPYNTYWEDRWQLQQGLSREEAENRFEAFLASPIKDDLKVVEGALKAIQELKRNYELVVVTSRYGRQLQTTQPWLEKHFPETFKRLEFVALWNKDKSATKATIAKEIGADYLVDDNADHCALAAEEGITALLFGEQGWNRNVLEAPGIIRVKNWEEVLEYFNGRG